MEFEDEVKHARKDKIGILRFYLLYYSAKLLNGKYREEKLKTYFDALDYLRWSKLSSYIDLYKMCLDEVKILAFREVKYVELAKYYEVLLDVQIEYCPKVDNNIYYNLATIYNVLENFDKSYKYLDIYMELEKDLKLNIR